jgi:4-hydroxy-tetrahydrodipicolinate synthase
MGNRVLFAGSAPALVTPFRQNRIDEAAVCRMLRRTLEGGSGAVVVCGTTGESAVLTPEEHRWLAELAVRETAERVPVIVGAGSNSTEHALMLIRQAEDAGADGLLLVTPYYNKTSQAGLIAHFTRLADSTSLPILLYDVPARTGMSIQPETLQILSQHPRIVGIKEAGTDLERTARAMQLCGRDFCFYSGNDALTLPLMALGCRGVISVAANIIPGEMAKLCAYCLNGEYAKAAELHYRYLELMRILFCDVNPIPVKEALHMLGLCDPELRLPLVRLDAEKRRRLRACLADCSLPAAG